MRRTVVPVAWATATCAALLSACGAQSPPKTPSPVSPPAVASEASNPYAALAKLPDWGGVWDVTFRPPQPGQAPPAQPKFTPPYQKQWDKFQALNKTQKGLNFVSEVASCIPPGVPRA